jgi:hypothetical protein
MHTEFQSQTVRKGQLGRPRHRWNIIIKMDPGGMEYEDVDWVQVVQYRVYRWAV